MDMKIRKKFIKLWDEYFDGAELPIVCYYTNVAVPGAVILTDGWSGYNGLPDYEYTHKKTVLSSSGNPAHCFHARRTPNRQLT